MKLAYFIFSLFCLSQVSYAATGNLKIPSDAPPGTVPSIDNGTDKEVSIYDSSDCSGTPLDVLPPDRATVDFESAWGGCLKIAA
ncbi:hypothetical protein PS6_010263 [Mucor atramentarius]